MGKADLHAHTCHDEWSDGNQSVEDLFRYVQEKTDLDLFGITDHDNPDSANAGVEIHRRGGYRFGYLPGIEVTNQSGHLLCYFPEGEVPHVPSLRPFWWTVRYVQDRGGICIPAHPVYPPWLASFIASPPSGMRVDGIESMNAGIGEKAQTRLAEVVARIGGNVAQVGNSDAHTAQAIGAAYTEFPGRTAEDFVRALRDLETHPVFIHRPALLGAEKRFTTRRSMTRPGWVRNIWREIRA